MVLEATMICVDSSEWTRNGDYSPNRFQAQQDAVSLICGSKTQANPENTVGILTMAGKGARVLVTLTSDLGKILGCMHGLEIGGEMNMASGIQVAQLALKHRQNKKQLQRIIVFAGSPVTYDKKMLEAIGRKLKKNSVSLDVISFGEDDDGKPEKLEVLVNAVNNSDSSHIVHVPPGSNALSDVLLSTPIFTEDGVGGSGFAAAAAAASGRAGGYDFGVDPNLDPELALALRVSMEEERARQEAAAKKAAEDGSKQEKGPEKSSSSNDISMIETLGSSTQEIDKGVEPMDDETALLQQAIAMSMKENQPGQSSGAVADSEMSDATAVDQELAFALQISVHDDTKDLSADVNKMMGDQSIVSSILASLPGVDPNDPSVKDLLASLQDQSEKRKTIISQMMVVINSDLLYGCLSLPVCVFKALQISVHDDTKDLSADVNKMMGDQSIVSSILASLPGVDPNDPSVKDLLASLQDQSESKEKKNDNKSDDGGDKQ